MIGGGSERRLRGVQPRVETTPTRAIARGPRQKPGGRKSILAYAMRLSFRDHAAPEPPDTDSVNYRIKCKASYDVFQSNRQEPQWSVPISDYWQKLARCHGDQDKWQESIGPFSVPRQKHANHGRRLK